MCIQGDCECEKRPSIEEIIYGKYCECDNFSCVRSQGVICGGPERGTCECGTCRCNAGWTGEDCTCRKSTDTQKVVNFVQVTANAFAVSASVRKRTKIDTLENTVKSVPHAQKPDRRDDKLKKLLLKD